MNNIGLYYPFIEFQDDAWVKLAALYWDKLGRIALPQYTIYDSDTVKELAGELNFVENFEPSSEETIEVSSRFLILLEQYRDKLVNYYSISEWPDSEKDLYHHDAELPFPTKGLNLSGEELNRIRREYSALHMPQSWPTVKEMAQIAEEKIKSTRLVYIFHAGRMTAELKTKLIVSGLARPLKRDPSLLGVHPKLAYIYLEALAEEMSAARQFHPVTDDVLDHLAVNGCTLERIAQVLFKSKGEIDIIPSTSKITEQEIEVQMATIALRAVLPRDLESVPTKKIIKLRKKHGDELAAFQTYLQELVMNLNAIRDIKDLKAIEAHLEVEYGKRLKPQLDDLKACLKSLGMNTVMGAMNIRVALPALVTTGGAYFSQVFGSVNPIIAGAGAIVFSVLPIIRDKGKEARDKIHASPAAYLLRVEENLEPIKLTSWVAHRAQEFFFQV